MSFFMDFEILAVFCFGRESIAIRIRLCSTIAQTFPGGAEQFRTTLLKYSIEIGFKVHMLKNDKSRITAICGLKEVTGCNWRVHASCPLNHPSFFKIKRLNSAHTCGSSFRDRRNPPMTKKLEKSLILNQIMESPCAYAGKELALKQIYGDDKLSYSNLCWFADSFIRTNPGSRVVLEVNPVTNNKYKGCLLAATGKNGNEETMKIHGSEPIEVRVS
ncbi:hypothetical protein BVC80_869g17 [Macleaya cordata]|uniref:Transposase MuDR plant domain-containing protein n=1 Tax=Macleaya cordata TaxID=56857 RepID=A0A200Q305_MACCD|nr:hypothetical protein BVC80_869g17 [Macleaya cordata]